MHKIFTNIGIRKTQNTDDSLGSGTKLLLPSWFIVVGNEHSDTSSNPGRDWLHFT